MQAISLPEDLQPHADFILETIRAGLAVSQTAAHDDVKLLRPTTKQFGGDEISLVLLLIGGASATWFTKKWADEYLWPILKKRLDKPSKRIIEILSGYLVRDDEK